MEYLNTAQELLDFIMRCKSPFHVVKEAGDLLNENEIGRASCRERV